MSYTTRETIWPATLQLDQQIKDLIGQALEALDDPSDEAGPRMAREFYTDQATVVFSTGEYKGVEGTSRANMDDISREGLTSLRDIPLQSKRVGSGQNQTPFLGTSLCHR